MTQPQITVGILSGKEIEFSFPVKFSSSVGTEISGTQKVIYQDGKIHWQGNYPSFLHKMRMLSLN
jgi:stage II sporulation protein D